MPASRRNFGKGRPRKLAEANRDRVQFSAKGSERAARIIVGRKASKHEVRFALLWKVIGGPNLEIEYRFHPTRMWRFDFAHPETKVAVELEGAVWVSGRHTRGSGFTADCEKMNAAAALGWRVFRFTPEQIHEEQLRAVAKAINGGEAAA